MPRLSDLQLVVAFAGITAFLFVVPWVLIALVVERQRLRRERKENGR